MTVTAHVAGIEIEAIEMTLAGETTPAIGVTDMTDETVKTEITAIDVTERHPRWKKKPRQRW